MYLRFNHDLEVMKNTTYIEKCLEFDAIIYIIIFTKMYCSLYYDKIAFCLRRGVLLGLKISDFGCKRGVFLFKIREKGVFFKLGYGRGIPFGREWGAGEIPHRRRTVHING